MPSIVKSVALLLAAGLWVSTLTACTNQPAPADQSVGNPSQTPQPLLLQPGQAEPYLTTLIQAAGSHELLKVELTAKEATVAVLDSQQKVHTWAMRHGVPEEVDGDTQYVGQATFSLQDFDLSNVKDLFDNAAQIAGSDANQQLQIVDYYHGEVYLIVTTNPESRTVFFRADGVAIPELNFHTVAGLDEAIRDVTSNAAKFTQIGWKDGEVWADTARTTFQIRAVRAERYPTRRDNVVIPPAGESFAPDNIQAKTILYYLATVDPLQEKNVSVEIDRRWDTPEPTITFTFEDKVVITNLAGEDITDQVKS